MKIVFLALSILDPSATILSASMFPFIPVCPLTHSKEVALALFLSLFIISLSIFACFIYMKFESVCFLQFSLRAFIAHSESVFICRFVELGTDRSTVCIASRSAVVFVCRMFWPMGVAWFCGSLGPNQTLILACVSRVLFAWHEPSVKTTVLGGLGFWCHI